jgi:hypothetical protein
MRTPTNFVNLQLRGFCKFTICFGRLSGFVNLRKWFSDFIIECLSEGFI